MPEINNHIADLLDVFHKKTEGLNSMSGFEKEPYSTDLIKIGEPVVNYIFQQGVPLSFNLMVLLKELTGFKPSPATFEEMSQDWLNWASQNHHL